MRTSLRPAPRAHRRTGRAASVSFVVLTPLELALVLGSAFLHAAWSVSIKQSGDPLCFNLLQSWTALVALAVVSPWIPFGAIGTGVWQLLAVTGVAHALYMFWMSKAYEHGDLSLVYPIARSTPAFLPLVAMPVFGESIHPGAGVGIAIVVAGIWLVNARAGWSWAELAKPATRFAFLTLAATVAYSMIDKAAMGRLAETPWPSPIPRAVVYSLLLSTVFAFAFAPLVLWARGARTFRESIPKQFAMATLASLISFVSYTLILKALETVLVSYVVAVRQTSVLFAVTLSALWLRERPGRARVLGAAATVLGVALIAHFS